MSLEKKLRQMVLPRGYNNTLLIQAADRIRELETTLERVRGLPRYHVNSVYGGELGTARTTWQDDKGEWIEAAELEAACR